jgi:foldase protein PrsA
MRAYYLGLIVLINLALVLAMGQTPFRDNGTATSTNLELKEVQSSFDYAAMVNDEKILLKDFNEAVLNAKNNLLKQNDIDFQSEEGQFIVETTQQSILEDLINQKLIQQEAAKQNVVITTQDINTEIIELRKGFPSEKLFRETLAEENINEAELHQGVRDRLISEKLKKILAEGTTVNEKELSGFLSHNRKLFNQPRRIHLRRIVVDNQAQAEKILNQLKSGESFNKLAQTYSLDLGTKDIGGDIGFVEEGALPAEINADLFNLNPSEYSRVLGTEDGFVIYQCVEKTGEKDSESEQSKDEARKYLQTKKENEIFDKWFKKIKSKAKVEYNPELIKNLPKPEGKPNNGGDFDHGNITMI